MPARPIFSQPFIVLAGLAGHSDFWTVPPGQVHIVKQITVYANPIVGITSVFFQDEQTNAALFHAAFNIDKGGWQGFYGALAFHEGSGFRFFVDAADTNGADVYAGGYVLMASS